MGVVLCVDLRRRSRSAARAPRAATSSSSRRSSWPPASASCISSAWRRSRSRRARRSRSRRRRSTRRSSAISSRAMVLLLVGTGVATTMIARGARKEAQTQLRNIANASVEGLILTDGTHDPRLQRERRAAWSARSRAATLRNMPIWEILDYHGDRDARALRGAAPLRRRAGPGRGDRPQHAKRRAPSAASSPSATCASAAPPSSASSTSRISTR